MFSSFTLCTVFSDSLRLGVAVLVLCVLNTGYSTQSQQADNSMPEGFRSLFDGKTLDGWKMMPRLPVPTYPGAPFNVDPNGVWMKEAKKNVGKWTVVDGAIVGEQDPPASGVGAYLVSEETFGDFELMVDMNPDWRTDTGSTRCSARVGWVRSTARGICGSAWPSPSRR